jgi:hypothetical protein
MKEAMTIHTNNNMTAASPVTRRTMLGALFASGLGATALAQEGRRPRGDLQEPVFRQATRNDDPKRVKAPHPLDEAIEIAEDALQHMQENYSDYTANLYKRERVGGVTGDEEVAKVKIRNRKRDANGEIIQPFSVYITFVKPAKVAGREALYVEGANKGKMIGHKSRAESALTMSAWLLPTSPLAMAGQLYPITEIGIENLINKLIERGAKERMTPDVEVLWSDNSIFKRPCRVLTLLHEKKAPGLDFHKAQIFIDKQFKVPVRYVAYDWPKGSKLAKSDILEEYTYTEIEFNVGLTDKDFDSRNKEFLSEP